MEESAVSDEEKKADKIRRMIKEMAVTAIWVFMMDSQV